MEKEGWLGGMVGPSRAENGSKREPEVSKGTRQSLRPPRGPGCNFARCRAQAGTNSLSFSLCIGWDRDRERDRERGSERKREREREREREKEIEHARHKLQAHYNELPLVVHPRSDSIKTQLIKC